MKNIQQVPTNDSNLYLINFNQETNELTFRSSYNYKLLQKEIITISNNFVYTNLYNFHIAYLEQFLVLNSN
jgi:hypothetical protein